MATCFVLAVCVLVVPPLSAQQLKNPTARRYVSILEQAGRGDYNGALIQLFQFARDVPSFTLAYSRIASFAFYAQQIDRADSFFVAQMALDTGNALYGRGLVARYREQYPEAVGSCSTMYSPVYFPCRVLQIRKDNFGRERRTDT
jgi:hypothetical protein